MADKQSDYELDSGIPVPKVVAQARYPFGKMKPGDSFVIKEEDRVRVSVAASQYARRSPLKIKFATRKMEDGTVRIWRTK